MFYGYFLADELSCIFLSLMALIMLGTIIHSIIYSERRASDESVISIHFSVLILFLTMASGVLLTAHIGLLWVFVEATTLSGAGLIYYHRDELSLEATWKYIFVCSIGISLAFVGVLFLSIAAKDIGVLDLSFGVIKYTAEMMEPIWLKLCFLFILTGFSVKMGLVPLFTVDIDAKDVSPSPIGGLFSSVLMNAGFVSIFRVYEAFSQTVIFNWMNRVLMIVGIVSLFFAAVYLKKSRNLKRMLAYSSLEHAGIVTLSISAGGIGYFAAILHLIFHSLTKASLFFHFEQIYQTFRTKDVSITGDYLSINPYGAFVLILGFLSISAMPPMGTFISEILVFKSLVDAGYIWIAIITIVFLIIIISSTTKGFFRLIMGSPKK
ncbi:MAG: hypothetical protein D6828_02065, partial [Nitrospirae bacterium]